MVNKAKKQGTTYETNIVNRLNKEVDFKAQRFAEGGSKDLGDIQLFVKDEEYGVCLGYSLDKYSYSVINVLPSIARKGILEYSTREEYKNSNEIVHPIVREVLSYFNIQKYF